LLGTLDYHKGGIQAVTFARSSPLIPCPSQNRSRKGGAGSHTGVMPASVGEADVAGNDDDDEEFSSFEVEARNQWLIVGGKDGRISVWELMDFAKPKP